MSEKKLTMVVPAYNEEEALPIFYAEALRVEKKLPGVEIEYLFIDDGCACAICFLFQKFWKGSSHLCRVAECGG